MKENLEQLLAGAKDFVEGSLDVEQSWGVCFDSGEFLLVYG